MPGGVRGVLRNLGWLLAGKGVGAVLSIVYLGLAARTLGAAGFGQFALVISIGQAIAALVGFQTWQVVVRYGAPLRQAGRHAALGRLFAFCIVLDLAAALAGCLLAVVCVVLLGRHLGWPPGASRAALAFCFAALLPVRSTAVGILRLYDRFGLGAAADATTPMVRFAGALTAVGAGASVQGFLVAWAAAEIVTAAAYWILARRVAEPLRLPSLRGARSVPGEHPGIWPFTWMTNVGVTLNVTSRQMAVVLVGVVAGPVAAGDYRLAYQVSQSLVSVSDMAARAAFAEFARGQSGDPVSLHLVLRRLTRLACAAALAGCLVLLAGGKALSLVAGSGHHGAMRPLQLLGVAAAIDLAGVGFEPVLLATGRARLALVLRLGATLCLIMGVILLLPVYGANGVAAATLAASACAALLFGVASLRLLRQRAGG